MEPEMVVSELEHELKEVVTRTKELVESMMVEPPQKKDTKCCGGFFTQHHITCVLHHT